MAVALNNSISPCVPNIRLSPASGLMRLAFGAIALPRMPSDPSIAGAAKAAMSVSNSNAANGTAICATATVNASSGSKWSGSERSSVRPPFNKVLLALKNHAPRPITHAAPAIIINAVASSRDASTSPSLTASSLRFWVGASVCWSLSGASATATTKALCLIEPKAKCIAEHIGHHRQRNAQ